MWAYVKDGSIVQTNVSQTRLVIRGTEFPAKYANEWTVQQKKDYGVYEVVEDSTNLKDGAYYTNGASTYTFASDTVTLTYASAIAREVDDTKWTQAQIDYFKKGASDQVAYVYAAFAESPFVTSNGSPTNSR